MTSGGEPTQPARPSPPDDAGRNEPGVEVVALDAGQLFEELGSRVLGWLRSQGADDPEDLLGEIFFQVARDLDRFRGDAEHLVRWVWSIARNRLIDDRRRRWVRPAVVTDELPEDGGVEPPEPVDPRLVAALAQLTELQRQVVTLRFVADLPLRDVARITRRPVGAVKAAQRRALARLALMLGES